MAAFPSSTPCQGCINDMVCNTNGYCASNPGMLYASFWSDPNQLSMSLPPSWPAASSPYGYTAWYPILCQHCVCREFLPQLPVPREKIYEQPYLQHHYHGQMKRKNNKRKNKRNKIFGYAQEVSSAIIMLKTHPQATLFSIDGIIAEVATADDDALHFIQGRIQAGSELEQHLGLTAALTSFEMLWSNYRGSRMLQELFISGSPEMKRELIVAIHNEGPMNLSLHNHGCRVIQTALTSIDHEDLTKLLSKFHGQVLALIHNSNGNHVVQRCIEAVSAHVKSAQTKEDSKLASYLTGELQFIIDDVIEHVRSLSVHIYGCRIVQRALEFCAEEKNNVVLDNVIAYREQLMKDKYGNYVLQKAIALGDENTRGVILNLVIQGCGEDSFLSLSKHKYASNVVEKLIQYGSLDQREKILKELLSTHDQSNTCIATEMAKDNIANYVLKTAIECACPDQKKEIMEELSRNLIELEKYPQAIYILRKESASFIS